MKPLQQLFGLALESIWEYKNKNGVVKKHREEMIQLQKDSDTMEEYNKRKEKNCSDKVEKLLFKSYLDEIYLKENNIKSITTFFIAK
jgi:hypothetical protein